MRSIYMLCGVACASLFLATGTFAEILGSQPGTSSNPTDNVPTEIQRDNDSGGKLGPGGGTGPGTRGDALTGGMVKEKPEPVTRQELERNAEKTHEGGSALAAETLQEKSTHTSKKGMKTKHRRSAAASDTANDRRKTNPKEFQQERSDKAVQGQGLVNEQPMEKQQAANRPASERGAGQK